MARLDEFHERFIPIVESFIRQTGNRTDKGIADLLGQCRQTIGKWRKKYPQFQNAINNPNLRIARKVDEGLEKNITKGRVEVVKDGNGKVKEIREISPTAQDFAVALKSGFGGSMVFNDREEKKHKSEVIKIITKRLLSGEISYVDAIAECESEEIPAPESWKQREIARIIKLKTACEITALEAAQLLESEGIAVPKTLMLEVQKAIGGVSEEFLMSDEELDRRIREFNNGSSE